MVTIDRLGSEHYNPERHMESCSIMVTQEKRSKYTLCVKPRMESWYYKIDGYIIDGKTVDKCDALFVVREQDEYAEVFIELKGSDVIHAITQLECTVTHRLFKDNDYLMRWARVSLFSFPHSHLVSGQVDRKVAEFKKNYNCDLQFCHDDTLTHDMFDEARQAKDARQARKATKTLKLLELLASGNPYQAIQAVNILCRNLQASATPGQEVNIDVMMAILPGLAVAIDDSTAIKLKYIAMCVEQTEDVMFDDNVVALCNHVLDYFSQAYADGLFLPAGALDEHQQIARDALCTIFTFLDELAVFDGDATFWQGVMKG